METMFEVYHLKYDVLMKMSCSSEIEVPQYLMPKHEQIVCAFKRLTNKRDIRIASEERDQRTLHEAWANIGNAAYELFKNDWYAPVAKVQCATAAEAIKMTTSINSHWYLKGNPKIEPLSLPKRSTAQMDIISAKGKHYLYVLGGYYSIEGQRFVGGRQ